MRIYCLNGDPAYPCFVLAVKGCMLMLDCSLNMKPLQYFLPQMLVSNQRIETMPGFRSSNGAVFDQIKEFNNRIYLNSTPEFSVPEFNLINVEDLDAVLISNANTILALPYLTKMPGFRAQIYCTEPVMNFGRMLMEELTHYIKSNQTIAVNNQQARNKQINESSNSLLLLHKFPLFRTLGKLAINLSKKEEDKNKQLMEVDEDNDDDLTPPPNKQARNNSGSANELNELNSNDDMSENLAKSELAWKQNYTRFGQLLNLNDGHMNPLNWKYLYSKEDVHACISKIKTVDFNEKLDVYGSVTVQAKSNGFSIGSCNWSIESDSDCIFYMSCSSLLNTHSKLFDASLLKCHLIDCMLLSGLNQSQCNDPEQMIQEFCKACMVTLKNQGNVLIPSLPTGKIYDLIEYLYRYLSDSSMSNIPVYFMSSVADQSVAFSNIFAEWLCDSKQNLVHAAESPFQHAELAKSGLLKIYPGITSKFNDDFHQPCILFASHPSLRFGEACHFVELWKNSPNNSLIFTDSEFNYLDALAPYQPIYANFYFFPIDTSLTTGHLNTLLKEPKNLSQLVVSQAYKMNSSSAADNSQQAEHLAKLDMSKLSSTTLVSYYNQNDIIKLVTKRRFENCDIESDLAQMLTTSKKQEASSAVNYCKFDAHLTTRNNHHTLKAAPKTIPLTRRDRINMSHLKKYTHGKLNFEKFLVLLRKAGVQAFKLIEKDNLNENGKVLMIDRDTNLVEGDANSTAAYENAKYLIEIDVFNKIEIDLSLNKVNVMCDNEESRLKVRDTLLKCLKSL